MYVLVDFGKYPQTFIYYMFGDHRKSGWSLVSDNILISGTSKAQMGHLIGYEFTKNYDVTTTTQSTTQSHSRIIAI